MGRGERLQHRHGWTGMDRMLGREYAPHPQPLSHEGRGEPIPAWLDRRDRMLGREYAPHPQPLSHQGERGADSGMAGQEGQDVEA